MLSRFDLDLATLQSFFPLIFKSLSMTRHTKLYPRCAVAVKNRETAFGTDGTPLVHTGAAIFISILPLRDWARITLLSDLPLTICSAETFCSCKKGGGGGGLKTEKRFF